MKKFIFRRQPKGYQGSKTFKTKASKIKYATDLKDALLEFNSNDLLEDDLYGIVYYFHKTKTGTDADNISKPIWDALKGVLFEDDKKIKLRIGGIIDLSKDGINMIDVSSMGGKVAAELVRSFNTSDHFAYIECGQLNTNMYRVNLEV